MRCGCIILWQSLVRTSAYLYDIESVLADPSVFTEQELERLRDQIISNLERAWGITGGSEDQLTWYNASDFAGGATTIQQTRMRA